MSNYKILFGITGSIAAYKSAYLISKLVQNGFEVKVVTTESALKFIGEATLEGLSNNKVFTDTFECGEMMSHINLVKWADMTIICPASANTINKMAAGIADNLITSLFLAHDWNKPFLIAPAMNTNMFNHFATQESLKKLSEWGVKILPTAEGYLACGDIGKGKLLEPDEIYEHILISINKLDEAKKKLKVLITGGGTKENIDGIRFITNLSTGNTAAEIANYFIRRNHEVTYLHAYDAKIPLISCRLISFTDFNNLNEKIQNLLQNEYFDAIIHNAAVSDYSLESIELNDRVIAAPLKTKISSEKDKIVLNLKKNFKILDRIKGYSLNKNIIVVAFKFTNTPYEEKRIEEVRKIMDRSNCDFVVQNDLVDRDENNVQRNFHIFNREMNIINADTNFDLSKNLEELIFQKLGGNKK